jgi:CheY-like chemotaxis protein
MTLLTERLSASNYITKLFSFATVSRSILLLLTVAFCHLALAAPVILINEDTQTIHLNNHVDILDNPNHHITIDSILHGSIVNQFAPIDLTFRHSLKNFSNNFWLRFAINNTSKKAQIVWLTGNHSAIKTLEGYKTSDKTSVDSINNALFWHSGLAPILKSIEIPAQSNITVFLDVNIITYHSLNLKLITPSAFLPQHMKHSIIFSFALGVLTMLVVINTFFGLYRKNTLFVFFSCYILANALIHTTGLGMPQVLFTHFGEWQHTATTTLFYLAITAALLCTQKYIQSTHSHNKNYTLLTYIQYVNAALYFTIFFFVDAYAMLIPLPLFLAFPAILSAFFYCYKKHNDIIALWIFITLSISGIIFIPFMFLKNPIFSLDLLFDPLFVYLLVFQSTILTVLFIIHDYIYLSNTFHKNLTSHIANSKHLAKNELLQEFSGDMQTPLSGILGMADLLKSSSLTAEQHSKVDAIKKSGQALMNKISDINYRVQLEQNSAHIRKSPFELSLLLENCISSFQMSAENKNIELILHIRSDIPTIVKGDEYRLRQIIMQLIDNAIKNTEQGEVLVRVSKNATDNDVIYFSIHDTGKGIAKDNISKLNKSLSDYNKNIKNIGIPTTHELLNQLKSELYVDSVEGEGSTFSFSLNLPAVDHNNNSTTHNDETLKYKNILIVDDNHTSCKVLKQQALSWGMKVAESHSGNEALAIYRAKKNLGETFDAVIVDYDMPHVSGIEVAEKITLEAKENQPIIIMLASLTQSPPEYIAKQAGVDTVLNKPASQKLLRLTLCNLIRIKEKSTSSLPLDNALKLHVLIADDNDVIRSVISKMMESLGINYKMVSDGRLALDAAKKETFDVILMDCEMPFMDGFEATQKIHAWQKERHQNLTPIIALTAYTLGEHKNKSIESGMVDYLEKPINMPELEAVLKRYQI